MFLSKLFGIFGKKKDKSKESSTTSNQSNTPVVPPSGTVGAAVGLTQPNQSVSPNSGKVAQSPLDSPVTTPDDLTADTNNPSDGVTPIPSTPDSSGQPDGSQSENGGGVETPPAEPEPTPPPAEPPVPEPPTTPDDSQNLTV